MNKGIEESYNTFFEYFGVPGWYKVTKYVKLALGGAPGRLVYVCPSLRETLSLDQGHVSLSNLSRTIISLLPPPPFLVNIYGLPNPSSYPSFIFQAHSFSVSLLSFPSLLLIFPVQVAQSVRLSVNFISLSSLMPDLIIRCLKAANVLPKKSPLLLPSYDQRRAPGIGLMVPLKYRVTLVLPLKAVPLNPLPPAPQRTAPANDATLPLPLPIPAKSPIQRVHNAIHRPPNHAIIIAIPPMRAPQPLLLLLIPLSPPQVLPIDLQSSLPVPPVPDMIILVLSHHLPIITLPQLPILTHPPHLTTVLIRNQIHILPLRGTKLRHTPVPP